MERASPPPQAPQQGYTAASQQGTMLSLDFESGQSLCLQTAEATFCVMVRDRNHAREYAD